MLALSSCNAVHLRRTWLARSFRSADLVSHRIALSTGTLRYYDGGSGPPLVLIEGFAFGALENWSEQAELTRNYRVIAPDLYWLGASVPVVPAETVGAQAAAVEELLSRLGLGEVDLVGASYGGQIALRIALDHPKRVRRLVLSDTTGVPMTQAERAESYTRLGGRAHEDLLLPPDLATLKGFLKALLHRPLWIPDFALPDIYKEFHRNGVAKRAICRSMAEDVFSEEALRSIQSRTLVLWGRHDPLLVPSIAERLAKTMPNAELLIFEGSGHSPMLEEPSRFNRAVREFLDSTAPTSGGGKTPRP